MSAMHFVLGTWLLLAEGELEKLESGQFTHHVPASGDGAKDWIIAEAAMASDAIDQAMPRYFSDRDVFQDLPVKERFYTMHRLSLARLAILRLMRGDPTIGYGLSVPPPDANEKLRFWIWMGIDLWKAVGEAYLTDWLDRALEHVETPYGIVFPSFPICIECTAVKAFSPEPWSESSEIGGATG